MRFAILAGGKGSRLVELTNKINKPLITIGDIPILLHVAIRFLFAGVKKIDILIGYESLRFKREFQESLESLGSSRNTHPDILNLITNTDFNLVETDPGADTFERLKPLLGEEPIMVTYGDTLTDVDVEGVRRFWGKYEPNQALTCVTRPKKRFSSIKWNKRTSKAISFDEKKGFESAYVGCGFIVIPALNICSDLLLGKSLERNILPNFANQDKLLVYEHRGFWHPIDYMSDLEDARSLWLNSSVSEVRWMSQRYELK